MNPLRRAYFCKQTGGFIRPLIASILTISAIAFSVQASENSVADIQDGCKKEFTVQDTKPLAVKSWKQAYGPTEGQWDGYQHRKRCHAENQKRLIKNNWEKQKVKYAPLRKKRQLKLECGNSSLEAVNSCINFASFYKGGANNAWMHRIAECESGKDPGARNPSGAYGLYQFLRSTWNTTKYAAKDWVKARWQSLAAAWMYRQGRAGEWVCN